MRTIGKLLLTVAALFTAALILLKNDAALGQRMAAWADNTVRHIEAILEERDSEAGEKPDSGVPFYDVQQPDWRDNPAEDDLSYLDGTSVISGYSISSELTVSGNDESTGRRDVFEGEAMNGTVSEYMSWVKTVTQQYAPLSWELMMLYDDLPQHMEAETVDGLTMSSHKPMESFRFLKGRSALDILGSMPTNVHETAHGYFGNNIFRYAEENRMALDWDNVNGFLYLSPTQTFFIAFPKNMLFPSRELVGEIPRELRTFRFDTYVAGTTSTQGQGVIGLLDEFHAYYHGARCGFDLFRAYAEAEGSEVNGLLEWIRAIQSEMTAYYEFDFFIKEYLLRMRAVYPDDYEALRQCSSFVRAYRSVGREYSNLVRSYEKFINDKMKEMNGSGEATAEIRDGSLWISSADGRQSRGTSVFSEDRGTLERVLSSGRYDKIDDDF